MRILGLNHSNDAACALVEDGHVVAACAEERFTRIKHDANFPHHALAWVLNQSGLTLDDIDRVAFFWNPGRHMDASHGRLVRTPRHHLEYLYSLPTQLLAGEAAQDLATLPHLELSLPWQRGPRHIDFVTHHLAHAAHAFFDSPFPDAAILTVDGYGERASTVIARGSGTDIEVLTEIDFPHSVGSVYAAVTEYLGFRANNGEGKVMGLASYGTPRYLDLFRELLAPTPEGFRVALPYFSYYLDRPTRYAPKLVKALGPARQAESPIETRHQDIAASLQAAVEEILIHLAKLARDKTGLDALCMAGGVVLNCVANERIVREAGFSRHFFQPACHDAGTSVGAALYTAHIIAGAPRRRDLEAPKTDYLGPSFSPDAIRRALDFSGVAYRDVGDPATDAAERLARGRIIGRFSGRAEFGPRALGNRSILAAPGPASVKDVLNARVKRREPFRPFAPSVLESSCGRYFDSDTPSPFMLRAYRTRDDARDALGAITHVDGSARVQTVNPAQNADYHALIEAYGAQSGIDCLLNTSFNVRGEPIVNTPEDALRCFFSTGLDDLYLGPFALEKTKDR